MVEPVTLVKGGHFLWRLARPITRVKRKLNKRRERLGKPLLEINERRDEGMIKEILGSLARTAAPAATAALAGAGVHITPDSNPLVTVAIAVVVYIGAQVWSIARKVVNKPRDV